MRFYRAIDSHLFQDETMNISSVQSASSSLYTQADRPIAGKALRTGDEVRGIKAPHSHAAGRHHGGSPLPAQQISRFAGPLPAQQAGHGGSSPLPAQPTSRFAGPLPSQPATQIDDQVPAETVGRFAGPLPAQKIGHSGTQPLPAQSVSQFGGSRPTPEVPTGDPVAAKPNNRFAGPLPAQIVGVYAAANVAAVSNVSVVSVDFPA